MKKRYVLNEIYWVASIDGKVMLPLVDATINGKEYFLNLKDKVLIERKNNIVKDVEEKYGYTNLKYYPSYDFLYMYEHSNANSMYVNLLAEELFIPVYETIADRQNVFSHVSPVSVYANFINHYDISLYEVKKFTLFAKAVLNVIYKKNLKEEKKNR